LQPQQFKQNQNRVAEINSVSKSSGWQLSLLFWFLLTYISLLFSSEVVVVVVVVMYLSGLFGSLSAAAGNNQWFSSVLQVFFF
jgi:hypothetical protein